MAAPTTPPNAPSPPPSVNNGATPPPAEQHPPPPPGPVPFYRCKVLHMLHQGVALHNRPDEAARLPPEALVDCPLHAQGYAQASKPVLTETSS